MDKRNKKLFWVVTLVLCVLLFLERMTGEMIHAVLGVILIVICAIHMNKRFAIRKHRKAAIQAVDWVLAVSLAVLFVTGLLIHPLHGILFIKILHKLSAVLFVLGIIVHLVQHRNVKKGSKRA